MVNLAAAILTDHAKSEMTRRGVTDEMVRYVLADPGQVSEVRTGRVASQSKLVLAGREYLLRVFVDTDRSPAEVMTAYLTSKIRKYWKETP